MDKSVLWKLSYGIYAIGVMDGDVPQGCIVNTVFQVSSSDMVAVSVSKDNYTHGLISKAGRFSAAIVSEETPPLTIGRLGFYTGAKVHKYEQLNYTMESGLPVLRDKTAGYLICSVLDTYDTGSHTVFFARVEDAVTGENLPVMTYEYYHKVVKGKAPKNAPTYQA